MIFRFFSDPQDFWFDRYQKVDDIYYYLPSFKQDTKPHYLKGAFSEGKRMDLIWRGFESVAPEGFAVSKHHIALIGMIPPEQPFFQKFLDRLLKRDRFFERLENQEFWIFVFEKEKGKLVYTRKIGNPTQIYWFPGTSNLICSNDTFYFVWNGWNKEKEEAQLHFVSYDPQKEIYKDEKLPFKSTWNISISVDAIDDVICLAYHGIGEQIAVEFLSKNSNKAVERNAEPLRSQHPSH